MKKYAVSLPFTGYMHLEVEAENEEDALDRAYEVEFNQDNIAALVYHKEICTGNVFHGVMNEYYIEEIK